MKKKIIAVLLSTAMALSCLALPMESHAAADVSITGGSGGGGGGGQSTSGTGGTGGTATASAGANGGAGGAGQAGSATGAGRGGGGGGTGVGAGGGNAGNATNNPGQGGAAGATVPSGTSGVGVAGGDGSTTYGGNGANLNLTLTAPTYASLRVTGGTGGRGGNAGTAGIGQDGGNGGIAQGNYTNMTVTGTLSLLAGSGGGAGALNGTRSGGGGGDGGNALLLGTTLTADGPVTIASGVNGANTGTATAGTLANGGTGGTAQLDATTLNLNADMTITKNDGGLIVDIGTLRVDGRRTLTLNGTDRTNVRIGTIDLTPGSVLTIVNRDNGGMNVQNLTVGFGAYITGATNHVYFGPTETQNSDFSQLTVNVEPAGSGYIAQSPSGFYPSGARDVLAMPNSGFTFSHWIVSGASIADSHANPVNITLSPPAAVTLTAVFTGATTTGNLTVTAGTGGSATGGGTNIAPGTPRTVTATAAAGYVFRNWTVTGTAVPGFATGNTSNPATFNMPAGSVTATANFDPVQILTVNAGAGGTVSGTPSGHVAPGTAVSVTANPAAGQRFVNWTITGATLASNTANPATFTMPTGNVTLTANFEADGTQPPPPPEGTVNVTRLFNPVLNRHVLSTDAGEAAILATMGWSNEAIAFRGYTAAGRPANAVPVNRFYNPTSERHFYTANATEMQWLRDNGWQDNGVLFYAAADGAPGSQAIYRLYNRPMDRHLWTANAGEIADLTANWGWINEGIAFYALPPA